MVLLSKGMDLTEAALRLCDLGFELKKYNQEIVKTVLDHMIPEILLQVDYIKINAEESTSWEYN